MVLEDNLMCTCLLQSVVHWGKSGGKRSGLQRLSNCMNISGNIDKIKI